MLVRVVLTLVLLPLLEGHGTAPTPEPRSNAPLVWFAPGPGTLDMLRLFEAPNEWTNARQQVAVFKFYRSQLLGPADPMVGPNTYEALRGVDAFRLLTRVWRKRVAIEVSAVKEHSCTEDASGTNEEIRLALRAIRAVREAGGEVDYLALDEPFTATVQSAQCGGKNLGPTIGRLRRFFAHLQLAAPHVRIGLIEQYPISSPDEILGYVRLMIENGIRPAFFHLDADVNALPKGSDRFEKEIPPLLRALEDAGVPTGIIIFGHSGDSDALYCEDALDFLKRASEALADLPRDVVFQSWAESKTGKRITPANLPEWKEHTHTGLIDSGIDVLRSRDGSDDAGSGTARFHPRVRPRE